MSIAALEHLARPFRRPLARTNGHQHTGDVTHHMVQKSIGADIQHDEAAMLDQLQVVHGLDR